MAVFSQFGSDLDEITRNKLLLGQRLYETLKQPQYAPMPVEQQIAVLYCAINGYLLDVSEKKVSEFNRGLCRYIDSADHSFYERILSEKIFPEDLEEQLKNDIVNYKKEFSNAECR